MSDEIDRDVITIDLAITNDPQADLESDGILLLLLVSAGKGRLYLPASLFTVFQRKRALGRLDALGYLDRDKETMHSNEVIQSPI